MLYSNTDPLSSRSACQPALGTVDPRTEHVSENLEFADVDLQAVVPTRSTLILANSKMPTLQRRRSTIVECGTQASPGLHIINEIPTVGDTEERPRGVPTH